VADPAVRARRPGPGWVCIDGGWVPAGHPLAQTTSNTAPAPSPSPPPDGAVPGCHGAAPGPAWVCIGGGWLPPDYPAADPAPAPEPAASTGDTGSSSNPSPREVAFGASADHATNVTEYVLKVFAATANPAAATPLATSHPGKPTPSAGGEIRVDRATFFASLAPGTYLATSRPWDPGATHRAEASRSRGSLPAVTGLAEASP
jgi:hypothetical protein